MKNTVLLCIIILVAVITCSCGQESASPDSDYTGGGTATFGFITYTEPLVSSKNEGDDLNSLLYMQVHDAGNENASAYSIHFFKSNDVEQLEDAKHKFQNDDVEFEEFEIDGEPAIRYHLTEMSNSNGYFFFIEHQGECIEIQLEELSNASETSEEFKNEQKNVFDDLVSSIHVIGAEYSDENDSTKPIDDLTEDFTIEQKNAFNAGIDYLTTGSFSKEGLINQLTSEVEGYPIDVAKFAVEKIEDNDLVDWDEECEEAAQDYLETSSFSKQGLIDQLCSDAEGFTEEQAEKAVKKVYQ